jgi:hypothetical protein
VNVPAGERAGVPVEQRAGIEVESRPSPNYDQRRPNFVILHHTTDNSAEEALRTLTDRARAVSSHYLIGRDGKIFQLVDDRERAWHAGESYWGGQRDINSASIGIELDNNGREPFAEPMIASLYHRGAFQAEDVRQTVHALMGYGVGLLGIIAVKILAPGFFARQDMRTPVKIAVGVLIFTQLLNLVLVPRLGQAALTLSISLGALANAGFLLWGLRRLGTYTPAPGWGGLTWRVLLACTVMGGALFAAARGFDWIALGAHNLQRIGLLAVCLAVAATLYFVTLLATGIRPREFMRRG